VVPAKRTMQRTESLEFEICERLESEKQFSAMGPMRVLGAPTAWGPNAKAKREIRLASRPLRLACSLSFKPSEVLP
jgi:hypothetical protein